MSWFPLPIFPEGSLASSIVTTVWVGVVVFSFMNLRFGWVFSGLVVPGYLVPLLIVKPWAAGIIVVEAVLTLWTVQGLSRLLARSGIACEFFGRDRFLALLIVSSFYRIMADVWLLPLIGECLTTQFGISFDYRNHLQSFGLIVICLAANQLWKTGVIRGAFPFVFNIGITYVLVRYGLMELTNFNITNLGYLYEDIATSVYAAPKAYIVLITTAIIASRMNLIYGWDFNGILIPALIALQWYEPLKILTSFVEALFILFIAIQALKLPFFGSTTVEGSRKFLLFFTISFIYKMAVGWAMFFIEPSAKVSDFYGFGYLLPTLMAIKMHQHERVWHQMRITAQISLVSVLIANVVGFSLTLIPVSQAVAVAPQGDVDLPAIRRYKTSELRREAFESYINSHQSVLEGNVTKPEPTVLQLFESGLRDLQRSLGADSDHDYVAALHKLNRTGFRVDSFDDQYYRVAPVDDSTGRPFLLINRRASGDLAVVCPEAQDERHLFEASLAIFNDQSARILSVGGEGEAYDSASGDNGASPGWIESIHRVYREIGGIIEVYHSEMPGENRLYVKQALPEALELNKLEERFGKLTAHWKTSDRPNPRRDAPPTGTYRERYCEFHFDSRMMTPVQDSVEVSESSELIDTTIRRLCYQFAPRASDLYRAPHAEELLHLDRHVLAPLFALTTESMETELSAIDSAATYYGYRVTALQSGGENFVLLREPDPKKYWGSILVRVTDPTRQSTNLCFQVPSRVKDHSILSFAATQFRRFQAKALIIAGTNTLTNPDATSQLTVASNRDSFFNLAHQAFCRAPLQLDRQTGTVTSPLVIQCRAYLPPTGQEYPEGDVIVAPYFGNFPRETITAALAPICQQLENEGVKLTSLAYDDATSPYAPGFNIQARYLDFTPDGTFALFWISPFFRENYELQEENLPLLKMLKAVGISIVEEPLSTRLKNFPFDSPGHQGSKTKSAIRTFREKQDIEILATLSRDPDNTLSAVLDPASSQIFLNSVNREGRTTLVANLARNSPDRTIEAAPEKIQSFIDKRAAWMEKTEPGDTDD